MKAPLETDEQRVLVKYCKLKKLFAFSVPNGAILKGTPLKWRN